MAAVIGASCDISKAFDTVDIDILLQKLEFYGIHGCALLWFQSYLKNKKQFVLLNLVYHKAVFLVHCFWFT